MYNEEHLFGLSKEELVFIYERATSLLDEYEMNDEEFEKTRNEAKKLLDKTVEMYYK